jgi:hypothetical protein
LAAIFFHDGESHRRLSASRAAPLEPLTRPAVGGVGLSIDNAEVSALPIF